MNFADMIFHHALNRPEKPAVILADRVVTYGMMAQGILAVTERLRAFDLAPGSLVSVVNASPIRHLILAAALMRLGLPRISVPRTADLGSYRLPVALYLEDSRNALLPGLRQALVEDDWFAAPARRFDATPGPGFPTGDAIATVSLSSGTTGQPKIFALSAEVLERRLSYCSFSVGQGYWDRMLCLPPRTVFWGFVLAAHALSVGKTLVFAATAQEALDMIAVYGVDCLAGSVAHLGEMLGIQRENPVPCSSLRVVFIGGSLVSPTLLAEARAGLCGQIVVQYGSTETGSVAFASAEKLMATEGATGFVAPWAKVQIVDAADAVLPPDTDGILRVRTSVLGHAYPSSTATDGNFRDGWFYPGDLGRVTEDGLLILSGRSSEIIDAGGTKLAPERIEEILRNHPLVTDVAAFTNAGALGTDEVWVAVVPRAGAVFTPEAIQKFYAEKGIAVARVVTVANIPRNQMGKVERERLRRALPPLAVRI